MRLFTFLFSILAVFSAPGYTQTQQQVQGAQEERIIYRYKEFERFDFEDIVIEGETGNPGDLSIAPRYQRRFENKLPYRKNFNAEIRKGIERVR